MIPYGRQSIDDDDIAAVVAGPEGRLADAGPHGRRVRGRRWPPRSAPATPSPSPTGRPRCTAAPAAAGLGPGDRGRDLAALLRRPAPTAPATSAPTSTFVDIDPATLNLDPAPVPDGVDGLVAVHYAGLPVDLARAPPARPGWSSRTPPTPSARHTPDGPVGNCARSDMCVLLVPPGEDDHHRRGRRGHDQRRRPGRCACGASATTASSARPSEGAWALRDRRRSASTTGSPTSRPRSAPASWRKLDRFVAAGEQLADRYRRAAGRPRPSTLPPAAPAGLAPRLPPVPGAVVEDRRRRLRRAAGGRHRRAGALRADPPPPGLRRRRHRRRPSRAPRPPTPALLSLPLFPDLTRRRAGRGRSHARRGRSDEHARPVTALVRASRAGHPARHPDAVEGPAASSCRASRRSTSQRGQGSHVWDVDGNEYVDFPMALGPVLLGLRRAGGRRRHPPAQLESGITFTLMHPLEVEVAERIVAMCPGVEAVRFGKSGSDALTAAVRAARALTGRDHVLVARLPRLARLVRRLHHPRPRRARPVPGPHDDVRLQRPRRPRRALGGAPAEVAAVVLEPSGSDTPAGATSRASSTWPAARRGRRSSTRSSPASGSRRAAPASATGSSPTSPATARPSGNGMPISAVAGGWRRHGGLRGHLLLRHPRRRGALAGGRPAPCSTPSPTAPCWPASTRRARCSRAAGAGRHPRRGRPCRIGGEPQRTVVTFAGTTTSSSAAGSSSASARGACSTDRCSSVPATPRRDRARAGRLRRRVRRSPSTATSAHLLRGRPCSPSSGPRERHVSPARPTHPRPRRRLHREPPRPGPATAGAVSTSPTPTRPAARPRRCPVGGRSRSTSTSSGATTGSSSPAPPPSTPSRPAPPWRRARRCWSRSRWPRRRRLDELVARARAGSWSATTFVSTSRSAVSSTSSTAAGSVGSSSVRLWFGSWLPDWRPAVDYRPTYSARAELGGGVLLDAIHELDMLVWLLGATPSTWSGPSSNGWARSRSTWRTP